MKITPCIAGVVVVAGLIVFVGVSGDVVGGGVGFFDSLIVWAGEELSRGVTD